MSASNHYYPLTANQEKLYYYQKLHQNDPSYNIVYLYKITGNLDHHRLILVIEKIANKIDLFKIKFIEINNKITMQYFENMNFQVNFFPISHDQSTDEFIKKILEAFKTLNNTPINLDSLPLCKIDLYKCNSNEYYLLIAMPHIIIDGHSYNEFLNTVSFYYNNFHLINNEEFIKEIFCNGFLGKDSSFSNTVEAKNFFSKETENLNSLEIPKINQIKSLNSNIQGKQIYLYLSDKKIKNYILSNKISVNNFFLSVYALFLRLVTDEKNIIIGFPILNRNKIERKIFGYFVNTLPLIIDFKNIDSFDNLTLYIKHKIYNLIKHQSFDINTLPIENSKFNNYFTYYVQPLIPSLNNCHSEYVTTQKTSIMSEFKCTVENLPDVYRIAIEYGPYFNDMNIEHIFTTLISNIIDNNAQSINEVLCFNHIDTLYKEINNFQPILKESSIKDYFLKIVSENKNRIAVCDETSNLTYHELDFYSNIIAAFLIKNCRNHKNIIVSVTRNNFLIAIIFGIIKACKTYVPIDLACPAARFNYILNDLGDAFIIGDDNLPTKFSINPTYFISTTDLFKDTHHSSPVPMNTLSKEDDVLYIIYTSGTTGHPKGVKISHKNLLSLISACKDKFDFNNQDTWTMFHAYGFDFSIWEIFGCLLNAGKLIIINDLIARSPEEFYKILWQHNVTILNLTPTAFRSVMREDQHQRHKLSLRYIIFGGEMLLFPLLKPWVLLHPLTEIKLINMYGITETTVHVTFYEISVTDLDNNQSIIGKPLANAGVYIKGSAGNILPMGITGEIIIFGEGVTLGYYNNLALAEKKFYIQNNTTFYCSGDLAKINQNNDLEYLGRMDKQVQLHGFRIELGEIESQILKSALVEDCIVDLAHFDDIQDDRIIAYVVPEKNNYNEKNLKIFLSKYLPQYMLPSLYIELATIPLTINGKIDFTDLRQKVKNKSLLIKGHTPAEKFLFQMVSEIVYHDDFSLDDNLLDIGLTSIDILRIQYKINEKYPLSNASVLKIFQLANIRNLSKFIEDPDKIIQRSFNEKNYGELRRINYRERRLNKD
jgi:amino acid adenylation domain-containing protein